MKRLRASIVAAAAVALAGVVAAACSRAEDVTMGQGLPPAAPTTAPPLAHALLPHDNRPFSPSQLDVAAGGKPDGAFLAETESCAGCHADTAAAWRTSAHAFASFNNPVYRLAVDRFRREVGNDASRFCAGCHDVPLLVDGAMQADVAPVDPRAHGGVGCRVCHGIESTRADGNGSYTLASSPIPIPREGDAESVRRHKARMALPPLRTAQMCGACHRAFLHEPTGNPAFLVGQDELGQWSSSVYAGSRAARIDDAVEPAACKDCHMPAEDAPLGDAAAKNGKVASHRFFGGHTWLSAMRGDAHDLARRQDRLRGAATIDIAAASSGGSRTLPADGAPVRPGEAVTLDVVVKNARVGHRFPAGTMDAQDTWVGLVVRDARGRIVAEAGERHAKDGDDPTAHVLRSLQADDNGQPLLTRETHRFRTPVYNHTILPRDAVVVRFRFDPPPAKGLALPLQVTARLLHRSRNLSLARATCDDARTARGAAFLDESKRRVGGALDPCITEPVTEIASSEAWIGSGADEMPRSSVASWRRLADHARGMLHALQEQADEARPSLERALAGAPDSAARAIVSGLFAELAIREGRTDEALHWLDVAANEPSIASHPAIAHLRGEALTSVWRWQEAVAPLRLAAEASPLDDRAWMHLAVALGSAGDPAAALEASARGLLLQPRDSDMLRVQALALESLGRPREETDVARTAFLAFRTPDEAPRVRAACSKNVPGCALERIPVHVHTMRAVR